MNTDDLDQIERLHALKTGGHLTDEEFQSEKARILGNEPADTVRHDVGIEPPSLTEQPFSPETSYSPDDDVPSRKLTLASSTGIAMGVFAAAALTVGAWFYWSGYPRKSVDEPTSMASAASPSATDAQPIAPSPSVPEMTNADQLKEAFRVATGHVGAYTISGEDGAKTVKPLRLLHLPFGLVLLTSEVIKDGCHGCNGGIGVHYLQGSGTSLKSTGNWPNAVGGFGYGLIPTDWKISEEFTEFPAIYAQGQAGNMGYYCGIATLTELRPEGPIQSDAINLSYSNSGAVDEDAVASPGSEQVRDVSGKITNIVKNQSFEVHVTGKEQFVEKYVRRGSKFVRVTPTSRLSC